jgi:lysophospholipase L1-like esterase
VNLGLALASICAVVLVSVAVDRVLGRIIPPAEIAGSMELVFPPGSHMEFQTNEFSYTVDINSLGYRDIELRDVPPGAFKILALGDSFTYGWGVSLEDAWPKQLEANLRESGLDAAVINLGKPGIDVTSYAELAERAAPVIKPDLIVVAMLLADDMAGAENPSESDLPPRILLETERFWPNLVRVVRSAAGTLAPQTEQQPVRPPMVMSAEQDRVNRAAMARSVLEGMAPQAKARFDTLDQEVRDAFLTGNLNPSQVDMSLSSSDFFVNSARADDPWFFGQRAKYTATYLARIRRVAQTRGAEVLVVTVPLGVYANEHVLANYGRLGFQTEPDFLTTETPDLAVAEACRMAGLDFHSVTEDFRKHKTDPRLYYPLDGHFTSQGHQLFADLLTPAVRRAIEAAGGAS